MVTTDTAKHTRANALLLLTAALWGFAFAAQRVGAGLMGPFTFTAIRFALGVLVLLPIIWVVSARRKVSWQRRRGYWKAALLPGVVTGTALTVAMNLQQIALISVPAGTAAFITGLYMVFVPAIAALRGHRSALSTVVGVVSSVIGLYLISGTNGFGLGLGELILVVSAVIWAVHILLVERFSAQLSTLRFAAVQFITCSVFSSVIAIFADPHPFTGIAEAWWPLVYGGVFSVGVAFTLQVVAQRDALASHAALILAMESVFGAVGGAIFLGESMTLRGYLGAALMVTGMVVAQWGAARAQGATPVAAGVDAAVPAGPPARPVSEPSSDRGPGRGDHGAELPRH